MSGIHHTVMAGKGVMVSGTLSGSGNLSIPAGASLITLVGQGGTGTSTYNAGQAYVAPYDGYRNLTNTSYYGFNIILAPATIGANQTSVSVQYRYYSNPNEPYLTTTLSQKTTTQFGPASGDNTAYSYDGSLMVLEVYYSWPPVGATPGQSYIAPYWTYTTGPSTTATLNGTTRTWVGGYGGAGAQSTQTIQPNVAAQSLSYSIGSGGNLSYSYIA